MGDYKLHSKETGIGLCNSFEDALKFNVSIPLSLIRFLLESEKGRYGRKTTTRHDAEEA